MRLLFLNHNAAHGGGTFHRAFSAARQLASRGHDVTMLSISPTRRLRFETERIDGVDLVHTPDLFWGVGRTGWDPWDTVSRLAYLAPRRWDVIHAWDSRPVVVLPALFARRRSPGSTLVMDWCDWWGRGGTQAERSGWMLKLVAPLETYFEESFRTAVDGSTVISEALLQRAISLGVAPERIRLLPQGCDVEEGSALERVRARAELGIPADEPLIVSVGALMRSDATMLFDVVRKLFEQRPRCRFALIGRHGAEIPDDVRRQPQFVETGFLPAQALRRYMHGCDALLTVLADTIANRARWPSKVNPFLALGRAVVITRVGDLPAMLEAADAAIVTQTSPAALADGIRRLLDDASLQARISQNARAVAARLAWPLLAEELEEFYLALKAEH